MHKYKLNIPIKELKIIKDVVVDSVDLKYASSILNLMNSFAQATRPKIVGQLSDLFIKFQKQHPKGNVQDWKKWYLQKYPKAFNDAWIKAEPVLNNFKQVTRKLDN